MAVELWFLLVSGGQWWSLTVNVGQWWWNCGDGRGCGRGRGQWYKWQRERRPELSQPAPRVHVDHGVLDERREHEHKAGRHPDVYGFDVVDARQRRVDARRLSRRRQHCQQADGNARRTGVYVDPERDPGQDDDEQARYVVLDEKVSDVAAQKECDFQARKGT